ncbi:glucan endo-1,3-beta-glucosidase 14-like [Pyrus x bretschneideri]|uniref:glucan endo-1,3-beta-glucosidase 14-like n=1 Tax=Pyrus x bretschneideri TaxID=225117 RepID=UPI0005118C3C|nr:glucan endo-1,3-beta-glucosidase 14-like [Pyrus x bretschneideri]
MYLMEPPRKKKHCIQQVFVLVGFPLCVALRLNLCRMLNMGSFWFFVQFGHLFLVLFLLIDSVAVQAFTGTYGINYGRVGDNLLSPKNVVALIKAAKIKNVRIYDTDRDVLNAFRGTGLEVVVTLPNAMLPDMSLNEDDAVNWVKDNVQSFLPETQIRGISVGNEVLGVAEFELWGALLGAAKNIYKAVKRLKLTDIQIYTPHAEAVFTNSYPPSSCTFNHNVKKYMKPLLEFFSEIGSPFCLNAYPFLVYMANPKNVDLNYALFLDSKGSYDPNTNLHYDNLLEAQIDAAYAALEDAGFKNMEIIVTETGWASKGDANETAATENNAKIYNYNLRKRLAMGKGTPLRPKIVVKAYVFALLNENLKPGPTSERNYGLFKANGNIAYDIGFHGTSSSGDDDSVSDSLFLEDEHTVSSSANSLLFSSKDIGAQDWFRLRYFLFQISAAALLLLLK